MVDSLSARSHANQPTRQQQMTSETSFREKGRAAFLAALMVMSVVAMSMSFAGAAAANSNDQVKFDLTEDDSLSGEDIWIGQELEVDGDFDEPVQLKDGIHTDDGDAETLDTLRPDDDGIVTVETDELEDGEPYHLYYTGDSDEAEFDVNDLGTFWANEHSIDADFDADVVTEDGTLEVDDDDRDNISVHVSGEHENETIDEDDLAEIFDEDEQNEDEVLIEDLGEHENELEADFSDQSTGDYEFTVDVVDTTAEDSAEITVGEEPEANAQFDESTYEQNVGDVAEFGVDHDGTEDVTITVTDEEEYYTAEIETEEDVSDADNLTVEFNSYEAGQDDGDVVTVTDDEGEPVDVDVTEALDEDEDATLEDGERLLPGDYELEVFPGTEDETDAAVLVLDDRSTGDMNTWIAPGDNFDVDEVELDDIENSTESDSVAEEDLLVVGVEASGIYGYALDGDGEWDGDDNIEIEFEDTDEPRYGSADSVKLDDLEDDEANVVVDEDENRFFVVVDATADEMDADETWDVTFTIDDENDYVDDDETADAQFDIEESFVEFVGDEDDEGQLQIENSNESEITAETNLAPGTDGDFRLRASSEIYTSDAEVDDDGVLATTFDLSSHDEDDEIRTLSASVGDAETDDDDVDAVFVSAADDDEEKKDGFKIDADAPSEVNVDDDASLDVTVVNNNDEAGNATLEATVGDEEYTEELELDAGDSVTESFDFDTSEEAEIDWSVETGDDSDSGTLTVDDKEKANGENGENGANGENGENGANGENG
ncbi:BGTF surface domain-containing protein, partial [Natronococcus sp.]|uniref:BGTF surface domain-containing protein n=1 Tax=Natronococcus sp. TaxID=35747 RepID=UPI003743F6D1